MWSSGKGNSSRVKGLLGQTNHHRPVFADGIQHDWPGKLRRHLAHDVDVFGLEGAEVGDGETAHDGVDLKANQGQHRLQELRPDATSRERGCGWSEERSWPH